MSASTGRRAGVLRPAVASVAAVLAIAVGALGPRTVIAKAEKAKEATKPAERGEDEGRVGLHIVAPYAAKPSAFVGFVTTGSPTTRSGAQKGARVAVCVGTKDPNFSQFPAAVAACEKTVVGRVIGVADLAHDLPHADYARECIAYVFD